MKAAILITAIISLLLCWIHPLSILVIMFISSPLLLQNHDSSQRRRMSPLTKNVLLPELEARLSGIGGRGFNLNDPLKKWRQTQGYANQTAYLLEHGQEFDGANAVLVPGDSGLCHANTAALYFISHGQLEIWTGWGLNDIGGWTEHTWGLYKDKIYDSAGRWWKYFGFKYPDQLEWATYELKKSHRWQDDPRDYIESCFGSESSDLLTTIFNETRLKG